MRSMGMIVIAVVTTIIKRDEKKSPGLLMEAGVKN